MVLGKGLSLRRTRTAMPKPQTNPKGYGHSTFDTNRRPNQFLPHFISPQRHPRLICRYAQMPVMVLRNHCTKTTERNASQSL